MHKRRLLIFYWAAVRRWDESWIFLVGLWVITGSLSDALSMQNNPKSVCHFNGYVHLCNALSDVSNLFWWRPSVWGDSWTWHCFRPSLESGHFHEICMWEHKCPVCCSGIFSITFAARPKEKVRIMFNWVHERIPASKTFVAFNSFTTLHDPEL